MVDNFCAVHLFHCPHLDADAVELPAEEAHHATHVLRLAVGDLIGLLNGRGTQVQAELTEVSKRQVIAQVKERTQHPPERAARIHLAVAPTKQMERFEWFVEKAVEVGVDRITPLLTTRTERARLRTDRLHRVAIAAMKQSRRAWLPDIDEFTALDDLLKKALPPQRFFGWCDRVPPEASAVAQGEHAPLMGSYSTSSDALVVIGPEGDLTPEEAGMLREAGFTAVSLGTARLRTETAALAACTWMSLAQQR